MHLRGKNNKTYAFFGNVSWCSELAYFFIIKGKMDGILKLNTDWLRVADECHLLDVFNKFKGIYYINILHKGSESRLFMKLLLRLVL